MNVKITEYDLRHDRVAEHLEFYWAYPELFGMDFATILLLLIYETCSCTIVAL